MSATIFRYEFRSHLRSLLTWSLAVTLILLFFFSIFPSFADQAALMNQMLQKFPPAMLKAFGLTQVDLSTVLGFYSFVVLFVQICLAVQASNYGFGLVSIEESELTADFLLSKPVSRVKVLTSKLLAAFACLGITSLVVSVSSILVIALFKGSRSFDAGTLLLILASLFIFQCFYLGVGLFISLLLKRIRSVTPFALGLAFGTYILAAFSDVFSEVSLELITPFKHLNPSYIVQNGAMNAPLVLLDLAVSLLAIAISFWLYNRRDIHAVS
jgi:ABC-2 type transport system permease protein